MSGEAGGLLLLPLAIFALPVVGAVLIGGAAIAGIGAATNAAVNYEQQQRRRREEIRRSGVNESIGAFRSNMAANMNEQTRLNVRASEDMMREIERSQRNMTALSENHDPAMYKQYIDQLQNSRENLSNTLFQIQEGFVKNYHVKINESMNEITNTINAQYDKNFNELQQLAADLQAKQAKARQLDDEYIKEAKTLLEALVKDYDGEKYCGPHLMTLQSELNEAIKQMNQENYEAALATAKDVSLSTIEEIYMCDCKCQEWDNYYKLVLTISAELESYLSSMAVVTEETKQKVEEKLGKPLEEDIVGIKISEYSGKTKDGQTKYDSLYNKIKEFKTFFESDEAKKLSIQQLKDYVEMMNGKLYPAATSMILRSILNMSNAFSRQNISEEIIDFFEEHNFTFKGYSYDEEQHDHALHIGLENEGTGEEIIVTLSPELMANGEVQTRVEIDQLMGDEANEERKAFYRASVENVVLNNTPGAQIKLECNKEFKNKLSNKTDLRNKLKA